MEKAIIYLSAVILLFPLTVNAEPKYLIRFCEEEYLQPGAKTGYISSHGDTIIAAGKYFFCYTDTLRYYAIVGFNGKLVAIDKNENVLFEVMNYDNGPDYESEGKIRILNKEGKYGYADNKGVVIEPKFAFSYPFQNGIAKVTYHGEKVYIGEYWYWECDEEDWFFINHEGNKVSLPNNENK